jgi:transaldolase / glucose-6-phosphate isomerase
MQPTGVLETSKATNPLRALLELGQSVWLDYIRRDLITSGKLKRLIEEDGLRGMTSNPAIFEKAIAESSDYDGILKELASRPELDATARFEQIAVRDIQDAADLLRPVYESSGFRDGFVSLEVSPYLAHKTRETIAEARRLWKAVQRDNVMIKVPGTAEGLPAIRQLIGEGININITLLFAQEVYEKVAEAYLDGLEDLQTRGGNLKKMASVASFFISRIDTLVDSLLNDRLKKTTDPGQGRHRQREVDLPALSTHLQRAALGSVGGERSTPATRALGEHQHEKSELPGCYVRGRTHWARHG